MLRLGLGLAGTARVKVTLWKRNFKIKIFVIALTNPKESAIAITNPRESAIAITNATGSAIAITNPTAIKPEEVCNREYKKPPEKFQEKSDENADTAAQKFQFCFIFVSKHNV